MVPCVVPDSLSTLSSLVTVCFSALKHTSLLRIYRIALHVIITSAVVAGITIANISI